jgi:hypothetical protein
MSGPWRNGGPIPEAAAPPIFPEYPVPKLSPVTSPYLKAYRPLTTAEATNPGIQRLAIKVRDTYIRIYPVGTLIPLTVSGTDYLAVFQWHTNRVPTGAPGVEIWVPRSGRHVDVILIGRWLVTFDTGWSWFYNFDGTKAAFFTDIKDPPELTGHGTWSADGRSVTIRWRTSSEAWFLPLKTDGTRGQSQVGQGGLSAKRVS